MKKLFTILAAILLMASVFAQSPEKMSYQAVIRNSSDQLVTNTQIGMQISILQASASGTVVYTETHTPTTNANGLVSIEIGEEAGFNTIDWSDGPYFIKTETDPVGGTSYTITGTNQLLSVPYAMYAKTSGSSLPGPQGEQGETGLAGEDGATGSQGIQGETGLAGAVGATGSQGIQGATGLAGAVGATGSQGIQGETGLAGAVGATGSQGIQGETGLAGSNGVGGVTTAGANVTVTGSGTTASPYVVNVGTTLAIGQSYQGGIIFWLDASGQHGLIAATEDQVTGIRWHNGTSIEINALKNGVGAGIYNTERIIANQGTGIYAAQSCSNYQGGSEYGDWFLPSKYELNLLYLQKDAVGNFANAGYWSSTEYSTTRAYNQDFNSGFVGTATKGWESYVRAVRTF